MYERRLGPHGQQIGSGKKSCAAMEVVRRVVVTKHESVAQEKVQQRLRTLVISKAGFLTHAVERLAGCINEPLDVVAIIGRASAKGIGL